MEQNREVFAVPGPVDSLASRGCHRLIRDGARLVETVDDILEELGPLVREVHTAPDETPVRHPAELCLSDQERSLLGQLDNHPVGVDELITRTSLTAAQVLATLSVLELKRLVRRLPGHQFVRACLSSAIRLVDSCERLSRKELERRGDADVRGIVGQAWWPKPIAH